MTNFYFDYKVFFYWAWRSDLRHAFFCIYIALLTMLLIRKWNTENASFKNY